MRIKQSSEPRGSLKWIQRAVNERPEVLNNAVNTACNFPPSTSITWPSPLREDSSAEYRDQSFLDLLAVTPEHLSLDEFWPHLGPQWDALGVAADGTVILVEAKANIPELSSPSCGATCEKSLTKIQSSLGKTKDYLGVSGDISWTGTGYQYANRIAHLHFLQNLNKKESRLVFVYFVGDKDVAGPKAKEEWKAAITAMHKTLGIPDRHPLKENIANVFIDICDLQ